MSDLFPYESPAGTTVLGEYQRQVRKQPLRWLLPVAIAVFSVFLVRDYVVPPDSDDLTWSMMRTADIELSVAQGVDGWPSLMLWIAGLETEEETLEWVGEEVALLVTEGDLTEVGRKAQSGLSG